MLYMHIYIIWPSRSYPKRPLDHDVHLFQTPTGKASEARLSPLESYFYPKSSLNVINAYIYKIPQPSGIEGYG